MLVGQKEFFLPHEDFPWFKKAKIEDVLNLELHHGVHLYWPTDVILRYKLGDEI